VSPEAARPAITNDVEPSGSVEHPLGVRRPVEKISNVFSVDVEDWYHANFTSFVIPPIVEFPSILEETVARLLRLMADTGVTGTFFVLGEIAAEFPDAIRAIADAGHEVASHGYTHARVDELGRERFRSELLRSVDVLEGLTGKRVLGFRAPSWSVGPSTPWIYDELAEAGLRYDASVMPFKTYLYGFPGAPRTAYRATREILEFPATTYPVVGRNIPFAGGFYLRGLPAWLVRSGIRSLNARGERCTLYIHPREICARQPKIRLSPRDHFVFYWGIRDVERKLRALLREFEFTSFENIIDAEEMRLPPELSKNA